MESKKRKQQQRDSEDHKRIKMHYDARPQIAKSCYFESSISHLKILNNWVKALLISIYTPKHARVIDLCGGCGGDLSKWKHAQVAELLLVDVSPEQIKHARARYQKQFTSHLPRATFWEDDVTSTMFHARIHEYLEEEEILFDVVSCQFAFHYCFQTQDKVQQALATVSLVLRSGGRFFLTVPDAQILKQKMFQSKVSNECTHLQYTGRIPAVPTFGARYTFSLDGAIDNCPEYLVESKVLIHMASAQNLVLESQENFHSFFSSHINSEHGKHLASVMKLTPVKKDTSLWETFGMYKVFVFQKK